MSGLLCAHEVGQDIDDEERREPHPCAVTPRDRLPHETHLVRRHGGSEEERAEGKKVPVRCAQGHVDVQVGANIITTQPQLSPPRIELQACGVITKSDRGSSHSAVLISLPPGLSRPLSMLERCLVSSFESRVMSSSARDWSESNMSAAERGQKLRAGVQSRYSTVEVV